MKPNCMQCKHFFITYDQNTPKGCKIYKIQSKALPSNIVKQANSGNECLGFQPKSTRNAGKSQSKNFSDSKYW